MVNGIVFAGKKTRIALLLTALLAIAFIPSTSFDMTKKQSGKYAKRPDTMFKQDGIEYPVKYANFQRNSRVSLTTKAKGVVLWAKDYHEAVLEITPSPRSVLVKGDTIYVVSAENLLVYSSDGTFRYMLPLGYNTPVVLGSGAFAYIIPGYLLNYQSYTKKLILEGGEFPSLEEYAYVLMFKPGNEDFIAAVQYTGGPRPIREPPRYDVYWKRIEKSYMQYFYAGTGVIQHALLTTDGRRLVVVQGRKVKLLNTLDMKEESGFDLEYEELLTASLDAQDNLVVIGRGGKNRGERLYLAGLSSAGKKLWEYQLRDPQTHQPPVCGVDGLAYVVDTGHLRAVSGGKEKWSHPLENRDKAWLTSTMDGAVMVVQAGRLSLFDSAGAKRFSVVMSKDEEHFNVPPVLGSAGPHLCSGRPEDLLF